MKPRSRSYAREIAAWAAFDTYGNLAYATIKPTKEQAEDAADRLSPAVEGYPLPLCVMPIFIGLDINAQQSMDFSATEAP